MNIKKMTLDEIKKHYRKRYSKILDALGECKKEMVLSIDLDCGRYLELFGDGNNNSHFKINHGINNTYPYNVWHKDGHLRPAESHRFRTQDDVAVYILKNLK